MDFKKVNKNKCLRRLIESALLLMKVYRGNNILILLGVFIVEILTCLDSKQIRAYIQRINLRKKTQKLSECALN